MPRFSHSQPRRNNAISTRAFEKPQLKCQAKIQVALIFLKASSSKRSCIRGTWTRWWSPTNSFILLSKHWQHPIKLFLPCKIGKKVCLLIKLYNHLLQTVQPAERRVVWGPLLRTSQPRLARVESPISFTLKCTSTRLVLLQAAVQGDSDAPFRPLV